MRMMLSVERRTTQAESGVIAIFMAVIISILLLTSTTLAARVTVVELNQSSSVDRSEQAYYAAEAGVEEAARRIDINPYANVAQMFPEQYSGINLLGDALILTDDNGVGFSNTAPSTLTPFLDMTPIVNLGQTSWRQRKVTEETSAFSGTQLKDETVQFDTTELCRKTAGATWGTVACPPSDLTTTGKDSDGKDIFTHFDGLQYCWTSNPTGSVPSFEVTDVYYPKMGLNAGNNPVKTEKAIIQAGVAPVGRANSMQISTFTNPSGLPCLKFANVSYDPVLNGFINNRYIIRIKALFNGVATSQNYSVNYQSLLLEQPVRSLLSERLYVPNNSFLIDVVGQSGDIKRRVLARKLRSGRLIGVFDYVIYSGSDLNPLCKLGVDQSEIDNPGSQYSRLGCTPGSPVAN